MIYDRYAEIYDESGQVHFSLRMIAYLSELLPRQGFIGESMLDLACGTGTLALSFAQRGWRAYGIDASQAMLAQARRKATELGLAVESSQQDMRYFSLPAPVDLVTCCYDSVNYLLSVDDLVATFARVAAALRPGGLFLCDANTPWFYEHVHAGTHFTEGEGVSVAVLGTYDRASREAEAELVAFVRRGELWQRFAETHVQRAHTEVEMAAALAAAGLVEVGRYRCFGFDPPDLEAPRLLWAARR
ncbi:MAG: class I SAM-dependent DNA methyltransferase [Chloroflexota bacterium]